jgi:hypothetical protein
MTTPRQPRLDSSSTAQISDSAEVSPESARSPLVRRRTSTNVRSSRFVHPDSLAVRGGPAQVGDEGVQIPLDHRRGGGVALAVVADEREQLAPCLDRRGGLVKIPHQRALTSR